ncbi:MAG: PD-(D/E)XK nuclease family protein [Alphaproteobacteria bacterium]|nr:MAG: PD-(D/E)XK nuclease family protein [Alphaproteobacteria bacterium]
MVAYVARILRTWDPLRVHETAVFVPTRRLGERLIAELTRDSASQILPGIYHLGALSCVDLATLTGRVKNFPPVLPAIQQHLQLAQLIMDEHTNPFACTLSQAINLAKNLSELMETLTYHGIELMDLDKVVADDFAIHWQITSDFLKRIYSAWPKVCATREVMDRASLHVRVVNELLLAWRASPPQTPIFVIGSSGSLPVTQKLITAIAELPRGHVVLPPGASVDLASRSENLSPTHHLSSLARLIRCLSPYHERTVVIPCMVPNIRIRSLAITQGLENQKDPDNQSFHDPDLTTLIADDQEHEAQMISCILRDVVEKTAKTGIFITHNRQLARRVQALMRMWGIRIPDSAGKPLSVTREGACSLQVLQVSGTAHQVRMMALRLYKTYSVFDDVTHAAYHGCERKLRDGRDLSPLTWPEDVDKWAKKWIETYEKYGREKHCVSVFSLWHRGLTTEICAPHSRMVTIWEELACANNFYGDVSFEDYCHIWQALIHGETIREQHSERHPRIQILGPLEARGMWADVAVLGGLVQGDWPRGNTIDPWMSRGMRADVGLSPLEQRTGLSCHDFVSAIAYPEVYITRSLRVNGQEQIPAPWWTRLAILFAAHDNTHTWSARAKQVFSRQSGGYVPGGRPSPVPPISLRPTQFSATDLGTLVTDPYSIFAKKILKIRMLDNLDDVPNAAKRGTVLHRSLELAMKRFSEDRFIPTPSSLNELGRIACEEEGVGDHYFRAWQPRFMVVYNWFIAHLLQNLPAQTYVEVWGKWNLICADGSTRTLIAKADRIDIDAAGNLHIIDYKTGGVPSQVDVNKGFAPQLLVEGLIASFGSFERVPKAPVSSLQYWSLTGGATNGQIVRFEKGLNDLLAHAKEGIERLLAYYNEPSSGYPACPHEAHAPRFNDYEALSRIQEWQ